jgi:hypothetical protein
VANHRRSKGAAILRPLQARSRKPHSEPALHREHRMLDVIMLAIGLGFFALSVGYTIACDRL